MRYSYITTLSTETYLPGVLALWISLKKVHSEYSLACMCSKDISERTKLILTKSNIEVITIPERIIHIKDINQLEEYSHWTFTFYKLYAWSQVQYNKLILLDSDMMILQNIDHLFGQKDGSAVISDCYNEPDCRELNSGLMVIQPSTDIFRQMIQILSEDAIRKENMGDQDIIRFFYKDWASKKDLHLPIYYNCYYSDNQKICKSSLIKVIHFIGKKKPWQYSFRAIYRRIRMYGGSAFLFKYLTIIRINQIKIKLFGHI